MSRVEDLAFHVIISFFDSFGAEAAKYLFNKLPGDDKEILKLRGFFDDQIKILKENDSLIKDYHMYSGFPRDWLSELEQCRYDMEDFAEDIDFELKNKSVINFLKTSTKYVQLINKRGKEERQNMEAGHSASNEGKMQAYKLLQSREDYKSQIIKELMSSKTGGPIGASIIGMGGIGKTVLATVIKDAEVIAKHFPVILDVPQSTNLDWAGVRDLFTSNQLSKQKRSLIVLDGMHLVDVEHWVKFLNRCREEFLHPESKFLITTQNPRIADVTNTSKYILHPLKEDECFSFIQSLANRNGILRSKDEKAITLYKSELAETSKGFPLLAYQIGILLAAVGLDERHDKIRKITGGNVWEEKELKRVLLKLKPVSLLAESRNLRRCLSYCSLFPPDHEFQQADLLQFWMAEGFTQPLTDDASCMENDTKRHFEDLLSCSLFQVSSLLPGESPTYKLHRLFYDMILNIAPETFCQKHIPKSDPTLKISDFTRHISLSCENNTAIDMDRLFKKTESSCGSLRTFFFVGKSGQKIKENPTFFKSLARLRVLDLRYANLSRLEKRDISNLINLRYLDLSHTRVRELPKLSKSSKLQILKLSPCLELRGLNDHLTQLTNLISLEVNAKSLNSQPSEIGKLINLQILSVFVVGPNPGFKIAELGNLNKLRESLHIRKLENVKSKEEAEEAKLSSKKYLDRLELKWSDSESNDTAKQVLEGLQPHKGVTDLTITNYCDAEFPEWLNNYEANGLLQSIHLKMCKALPSVDQMRQLKTLRLEAMSPIDPITDRSFPYIETFVLCNMTQMDLWIDLAADYMPKLLNLRVDRCKDLTVFPPLDRLKSLEKLELFWCSELKSLPTLPDSLRSLYIDDSDELEELYRAGGAQGLNIREDIEVFINSSNNIQETSNGHQNTSTTGEAMQVHHSIRSRFRKIFAVSS